MYANRVNLVQYTYLSSTTVGYRIKWANIKLIDFVGADKIVIKFYGIIFGGVDQI